MRSEEFSVVEYFPEKSGQPCMYCKSPNTYSSYGMWAHSMSVTDYQNLLDRGWRRSGQYVYKPSLSKSCCPMYTIRCDARDMEVSKSQKKVLKRFHNYLRYDGSPRDFQASDVGNKTSEGHTSTETLPSQREDILSEQVGVNVEGANGNPISFTEDHASMEALCTERDDDLSEMLNINFADMNDYPSSSGEDHALVEPMCSEREGNLSEIFHNNVVDLNEYPSSSGEGQISIPLPMGIDGVQKLEEPDQGVDLSNVDASEATPRPRKAKLVRLYFKYKRLRSRGMTEDEAVKLTYGTRKTFPKKLPLEEYFPGPLHMHYYIHNLKVESLSVSIVKTNEMLLEETHRLYAKYQVAVHNDSPEDCSMEQFKRILVDTPLFDTYPTQRPPCGFGSFHQQYRLDGNLIAVGVIDILPKGVSSVYFFYDPDLRSLTLGTYGSLHELYFIRSLALTCTTIKFYYMGYYIHHCPKMEYKGRYQPSYLLCPETYTWHRIEKCLPMLNAKRYCRFEKDPSVIDEDGIVNLAKVMILYKERAMGYIAYKGIRPEAGDEDVQTYSTLVGRYCYKSILLYKK